MGQMIDFSIRVIEEMDGHDIHAMTKDELRAYLEQLQDAIDFLEASEPRKMGTEEHELWGDRHEKLEDRIEDAQEVLDELLLTDPDPDPELADYL